jgi:hypothetical protein
MRTTLYVLAAIGLIVFGLALLTYRPATPQAYASSALHRLQRWMQPWRVPRDLRPDLNPFPNPS